MIRTVCLTEMWLHDEIANGECSIEGYNLLRCDRETRGGGIAVYISGRLMHDVIVKNPRNLEFILVQVYRPCDINHKVHVGLWYRPPAESDALDVSGPICHTYVSKFGSTQ